MRAIATVLARIGDRNLPRRIVSKVLMERDLGAMRPEYVRQTNDMSDRLSAGSGEVARRVVIEKNLKEYRIPNNLILVLWLAVTMLFIAFSPSLSLAQEAPMEIEGATTLDAKGVIDLILTTPGLVVVDTRTKTDFEGGHIEGAINILDTDITSAGRLAGAVTSKSTPVLFYCNGVKCGRAAKATVKAVEWGYSKVYYYALGINDWKSVQLPLVTR